MSGDIGRIVKRFNRNQHIFLWTSRHASPITACDVASPLNVLFASGNFSHFSIAEAAPSSINPRHSLSLVRMAVPEALPFSFCLFMCLVIITNRFSSSIQFCRV